MDAAGHQVVAGAFRGAFHEDRRFHLDKSAGIKKIVHELGDPVAQHQVFFHAAAAQVEIAVFQAQVFIHLNLFIDVERRGIGGIENLYFPDDDLDIAGGYFQGFRCRPGAKLLCR